MLDLSPVDDSGGVDSVQETAKSVEEKDYSAVKEVPDTSPELGSDESESVSDEEELDAATKMHEFSFGESKVSIPADGLTKEIADEIQVFSDGVQSDYAKGKQQIEDGRASLGLQEKALHNLSNLNDTTLNTYSQGLRLKEDIQQLSQVDMNALWQSNPDQARQVSDVLGKKQSELQAVISQIVQQEQELSHAQQEEVQRRHGEGVAILDRKYKNFSTEQSPKLIKYAVSKGMNSTEAGNWALNPIMAEMAYKAMLYEDMQNKMKNKPKPKQVTSPVKSAKTKGSSIPGVKNLDKMSMDEYAKWRNSSKNA